jgi:hypothetical protein
MSAWGHSRHNPTEARRVDCLDNYYDQVINFAQTDGRDRCNLTANCSKKRRGAKSPFHPIGGTLAAGTFFAISLRARTPHAVVIDQGE